MNVVILRGILSSEPRERTLPSGTNVLSWEVTTRSEGRAQSVPVEWHDPPNPVLEFGDGDEVVVLGSVRRRFFRAAGATVSRTEVLAERATKASRRAGVARLVERATDLVNSADRPVPVDSG